MTYTLTRPETKHTPAARCIFKPYTNDSGKRWVEVSMLHLTNAGWGSTMGRGEGVYSVKHAREFYASLIQRGFVAA
jgi:hypothetical protein